MEEFGGEQVGHGDPATVIGVLGRQKVLCGWSA